MSSGSWQTAARGPHLHPTSARGASNASQKETALEGGGLPPPLPRTCTLGACPEISNINEGRVYWISFPGLLKVAPGHRQLLINRHVPFRRSHGEPRNTPEP